MKYYLTALALTISFTLYLPLWVRIFRRKTTGDHSKWTWAGVLLLQFLGLGIAWYDGAETLYSVYYPAHIVLVGLTNVLVWVYYD